MMSVQLAVHARVQLPSRHTLTWSGTGAGPDLVTATAALREAFLHRPAAAGALAREPRVERALAHRRREAVGLGGATYHFDPGPADVAIDTEGPGWTATLRLTPAGGVERTTLADALRLRAKPVRRRQAGGTVELVIASGPWSLLGVRLQVPTDLATDGDDPFRLRLGAGRAQGVGIAADPGTAFAEAVRALMEQTGDPAVELQHGPGTITLVSVPRGTPPALTLAFPSE